MEFEWKILDFLDALRNQFFDILNYFISFFFGSLLLIILFLVIYWIVDKEKGQIIGFTFISCVLFNNLIKGFFHRKRPFEYENKSYLRKLQNSKLDDGATGTSFPSGHSQNSASLYTSLILSYPGKRFRFLHITLIVIICLVGLSRMYLGVHFPSDVVAGILLGIGIATVMVYLQNRLDRKKIYVYVICSIAFLPCLFFDCFGRDFIKSYGLLLGFTLGVFLENRTIDFHCNVSRIQKIIRLIIGILIVGSAYLIYHLVPDTIHYNFYFTLCMHFVIAFLGVYVVPLLFTLIEKKGNSKKC